MEEHLSRSRKSPLIKDDVEVVLMRLERARNAIQEIRPILLNHVQKRQPRFTETEQIYTNFMSGLRREEEANDTCETIIEQDPMSLISEAIELLGKISALISANKAGLVLTSLNDQTIQAKALRLSTKRDSETKDELSPEQDFYFRLADSDLV